MSEESCCSCRWERDAKRYTYRLKKETTVHECRFRAPDPTNGWPEVQLDDWCAEYEKMEDVPND